MAKSPGASLPVGDCAIELVIGDITDEIVDVIVNAANRTLLGGGGVDGAIHRKGGPAILEECRKLDGCRTGDAKITRAGNLTAKFVVHAVGPVYQGGSRREAELLASAYRRSLELSLEHGAASVAFPSISTGAFRYPLDEAARIALHTVRDFLLANGAPKRVRFVLFDAVTYAEYERALKELGTEQR